MGLFNALISGDFSSFGADSDAAKVFGALFGAANSGKLTKQTLDDLDAIPEGTTQDGGMTITKTSNRVNNQGQSSAGPTPTPTEAKNNAPATPSKVDVANRLYGK